MMGATALWRGTATLRAGCPPSIALSPRLTAVDAGLLGGPVRNVRCRRRSVGQTVSLAAQGLERLLAGGRRLSSRPALRFRVGARLQAPVGPIEVALTSGLTDNVSFGRVIPSLRASLRRVAGSRFRVTRANLAGCRPALTLGSRLAAGAAGLLCQLV